MLALIDLDHFKLINDMHGHAAGDAVLKALASASRLALRTQDRLGRLGGEEFLLVLPGCSAEEIPAVFARLRNAVAAIEIAGLPADQPVRFCMGAVSVTAGAAWMCCWGRPILRYTPPRLPGAINGRWFEGRMCGCAAPAATSARGCGTIVQWRRHVAFRRLSEPRPRANR